MAVEMKPIASSNLTAAGYDEDTKTLHLAFKNATYTYEGVDKDTYNELLNSTSKGAFFHSQIKGALSPGEAVVKRVALYLRVSTTDQTIENQRRELEAAATRHGWNVVSVFSDEGISGAKGRDKRPGLDNLLKAVSRKDVDLVAAWSVDRLGRSLRDLVGILSDIHSKSVDLYLHQQGLDTSTPTGKAMFQMMGVFAEFEREMIRERIAAGLARSRSEGTKFGRPRVSAERESMVKTLLSEGYSYGRVSRAAKVGVSVVQRVAAEMEMSGG